METKLAACEIRFGLQNNNPQYPAAEMFARLYPASTLLTQNERNVLAEFYESFGVKVDDSKSSEKRSTSAALSIEPTASCTATARIQLGSETIEIPIHVGKRVGAQSSATSSYEATPAHDALLAHMTLTHASNGDFCLLGARGSGKTTLVEEWARRLGYEIDTISLYADLNSRELLQTRVQLLNGDTIWSDSLLVAAAKAGRVCVLDGIERHVYYGARTFAARRLRRDFCGATLRRRG